jgi:hypothetical protein
MLKQLLHTIETAVGPIHMNELSHRLGIERSALEGMVAYWVQKGRLRDDQVSTENCTPSTSHCGPTCSGTTTCAFVAKMPKSYSLPRD